MKYIFAGDRDISVWVLEELMKQGLKPLALLVSEPTKATHAGELITISKLPSSRIFVGKEFESADSINHLKALESEYILGIHFPYLIKKEILEIPKIGFLNLHPALLPFNRGWHTPSWAILDKTPIGATLHFMAEELDNGDVICQKALQISPADTANTLYTRLKELELEVFRESIPMLLSKNLPRISLRLEDGTSHKRKELFSSKVQQIDLNEMYKAGELLDKLRALSTNQWAEAAYFDIDGRRYRLKIEIQESEL